VPRPLIVLRQRLYLSARILSYLFVVNSHPEYARQDRKFPVHRCGFSRPVIASFSVYPFDFEIFDHPLIDFVQSSLPEGRENPHR
jgi:hypothetical protein